MALPTADFDESKVLNPAFAYVTFTPVVGGTPGTAVTVKFKKITYDQSFETVEEEKPDVDGYLRPYYQDGIRRGQTFSAESGEIKGLNVFGGSTVDGAFTNGTVAIWVCGRRDASGQVSLKSNTFKATWMLEGGYDLTAGVISRGTIKITALEKATLTPDTTA